MMKTGAPPDKIGVLHRLLPMEFHGFTSRIDFKGYHTLVPGVFSIILEMAWVPLMTVLTQRKHQGVEIFYYIGLQL